MVKLGEVAKERRESIKTDKANKPIVGLEHLIPQQVQLTEWSNDADNTFTKLFHKGDVLFGRRRAYLKKASLAPFDGICSGDITVIAPIENKIAPELLPFIIQNDAFFDYAVEKSAGSLSPRVKWEHLKNYEFELPGLEEQRKLAKILWAVEETKQAYKTLFQKTDDLVKAKFEEMFGDLKRERLGNYIEQIRGVSYKPTDLSPQLEEGYITLLRANNIADGTINFDDVQYVSRKKVSNNQIIQQKDILMCASSGSLEHVGKTALCSLSAEYTFGAFCKLIRANNGLKAEYIFSYMNTKEYRNIIKDVANGANINNLRNEDIENIMIPIPSDKEQDTFICFYNQAEKSKLQLQTSLDSLNATMRALINENLK